MLFLHERQCSSLFKFGISEKENFDFLIDRFSFCTIQCTWLTMIALYCRIILQGQEKMCNSISEREKERERKGTKTSVEENRSQGGEKKIWEENYYVLVDDDMYHGGSIVHRTKNVLRGCSLLVFLFALNIFSLCQRESLAPFDYWLTFFRITFNVWVDRHYRYSCHLLSVKFTYLSTYLFIERQSTEEVSCFCCCFIFAFDVILCVPATSRIIYWCHS